jgi:hypothetical protein
LGKQITFWRFDRTNAEVLEGGGRSAKMIGRSNKTPFQRRSNRLVLIFASCENILSKKRTGLRFSFVQQLVQ